MDEQADSQAWADYYNVIAMIETYYYKMLELFRIYCELKNNGKTNPKLMTKIQSYISTLYFLLKNYKSIRDDKKLKIIFAKIKVFLIDKKMNDQALTESVDAIVDAHFILGLSKIEKPKVDPGDAL